MLQTFIRKGISIRLKAALPFLLCIRPGILSSLRLLQVGRGILSDGAQPRTGAFNLL
jgi:hypothetical protein